MPLAIEITPKHIYIHKPTGKLAFPLDKIKSLSLAYWGNEKVQYQTDLEASIKELLKVEIGTICLFIQLKDSDEIEYIELCNADPCAIMLKSLITAFPKLWKGVAPYDQLCKILKMENKWNINMLSKNLLKQTVYFYLAIIAMFGLKQLIDLIWS